MVRFPFVVESARSEHTQSTNISYFLLFFAGELFTTVGCHPTKCSEFDKYKDGPEAYFKALKSILASPEAKNKVVAIGECGLGKHTSFFLS